jgi:hypothetical protein
MWNTGAQVYDVRPRMFLLRSVMSLLMELLWHTKIELSEAKREF